MTAFVLAACLLLPAVAAERIVSIGGAVTETVYALGAGGALVAVDSTSRHPPAATQLPNVGYMRRLAAEPILALQPTLVLAVEDAGPAEVLDQLRAGGVPLVMVPDVPTPEGVLAKVTTVAEALGRAEAGVALQAELQGRFAALQRAVAEAGDRPAVLFLLSIGRGTPLAAGRDTAAAAIIELAGGRNAVDGFDGYKPLSPEAAVAAAPDAILVARRTLELLGGEAGLLALPDIALTPAAKARRIIALDGLLLLGFGPRTPQAVAALAAALHPGLALPDLPR